MSTTESGGGAASASTHPPILSVHVTVRDESGKLGAIFASNPTLSFTLSISHHDGTGEPVPSPDSGPNTTVPFALIRKKIAKMLSQMSTHANPSRSCYVPPGVISLCVDSKPMGYTGGIDCMSRPEEVEQFGVTCVEVEAVIESGETKEFGNRVIGSFIGVGDVVSALEEGRDQGQGSGRGKAQTRGESVKELYSMFGDEVWREILFLAGEEEGREIAGVLLEADARLDDGGNFLADDIRRDLQNRMQGDTAEKPQDL